MACKISSRYAPGEHGQDHARDRLIVTYGYVMEAFMSWYARNAFEQYTTANRMFGPYAPIYWTMLACNCLVPQLLWSKRIRTSVPALFVIALLVNLGMWTERFVIVVTSLHRDFLPSSWACTIRPSGTG